MNSCYNYPCTEDPYFSYYSSPLEDHIYQEPFLGSFEVLSSSPEENHTYNHYQYQSYEVRRHHNSETFYYKTDEELYSTTQEGFFDGKLLGQWDGLNFLKKVIDLFGVD